MKYTIYAVIEALPLDTSITLSMWRRYGDAFAVRVNSPLDDNDETMVTLDAEHVDILDAIDHSQAFVLSLQALGCTVESVFVERGT